MQFAKDLQTTYFVVMLSCFMLTRENILTFLSIYF